ncbi:MAG: cobalt ECF transporter T component CbiQ [Steroidobacteraceae bacterium]|nr:cobalt ECF transporter T component CbiQ [Pseudomonadota bacterium]MBP6105504.1 cobalt ECF transporter T component CbiQ [Steroidobacteraceae bacterium]MBP7013577.1 cobalt ECF transporter T component CbiQ [Steroidobacteraceae bacterium]
MHRLPAGSKLALALVFILCIVLLPPGSWLAFAVLSVALVAAALGARVSPRQLLVRLLLVEPLVIGVALLALLQPGGWPLFLSMLAKSTLCLACMLLLTATTRFSDLLRVLWRLRVPSLLVTTLALLQRYLFVLLQEMERMQRARRSRSFHDGRASTWRGSAQVAGQLFVRTSERAERVYLAMCARGWKS